jgi:hypothetical protein
MEEFYKIACMHDAAVRTEIPGAVLYHAPGKEHTGKFFSCDTYPWISLGILEEYVVTRFELLDKVILQQQSISLGLHDGILGIGYL